MSPTAPLDPLTMIVSQLRSITKDIKALPLVVARLEALTELTRQMENTWRESAAEFRERGEKQQQQIQAILLHQHGLDAALSSQIINLDKLQRAHDVGTTQLFINNQRAASALDAISALKAKVDELKIKVEIFDPGARQKISDIHARLERGDATFERWRPWLAALKWVTLAAAVVVIALLVGAAWWGLGQYLSSGGGIP